MKCKAISMGRKRWRDVPGWWVLTDGYTTAARKFISEEFSLRHEQRLAERATDGNWWWIPEADIDDA